MQHAKIICIGLLTALAMSGAATAQASATVWEVEKSPLFGAEAISNSAISLAGGILEGRGLKIECPTLKIEEGLIKEGNTGMAGSLTFSECNELNEEARCELQSTVISLGRVKIEVINSTEILISPEGTELGVFKVINKTGKICILKQQVTVAGSMAFTVGKAGTSEKLHLLSANGGSLTFNSSSATLSASGYMLLSSLRSWNIH
jgi:hypothetical protein